jgi:hypothetical protein
LVKRKYGSCPLARHEATAAGAVIIAIRLCVGASELLPGHDKSLIFGTELPALPAVAAQERNNKREET